MTELWIFVGLVALLVTLLVLNRRRDSRLFRRPIRETVSQRLRDELEEENRQARERRDKFDQALRQARGEKD